jgi:hypothetical protein
MRFLKTGAGRWVVPAALAAVLASALLITPVIAGTSGISGKKVNKTIAKKTNVTQLTIAGAPNLSTSQTTLGTLSLGQGSYDVTSTFDVRQNAADQSDTFVGTGTISDQSSVAMEVAGQAKTATTAQLLCSSTQAANINHADITALKVPVVKIVRG